MKKVLIAPDKFKGSLTALQVCEAIANGLEKSNRDLEISLHPLADGGDGSLAILRNHLNLEENRVLAKDPLGRKIPSVYFTSKESAYIEVATNSGLVLLSKEERNPLYTSSSGSGELIKDAISKGIKNIYIFLGGSGTNDAGIGLAHSLGFEFLDISNNTLTPVGENLIKIQKIINTSPINFSKVSITFFYDVANPLYGKNGAAHIYAPQKGATQAGVKILDDGLRNISQVLKKHTGLDISKIEGIGAAGGMAACLVALLDAKLMRGFDFIAEQTNLEEKIEQADIVISGEGKLDRQSLEGKVIDGVAKFCRKYQKRLLLFVGQNELDVEVLLENGVDEVFSLIAMADNKADAILNGEKYLEHLAAKARL
ncbi:MAG: glycerate kinase [Saprospiraceae bacterium]